jgi:hypothetical protein
MILMVKVSVALSTNLPLVATLRGMHNVARVPAFIVGVSMFRQMSWSVTVKFWTWPRMVCGVKRRDCRNSPTGSGIETAVVYLSADPPALGLFLTGAGATAGAKAKAETGQGQGQRQRQRQVQGQGQGQGQGKGYGVLAGAGAERQSGIRAQGQGGRGVEGQGGKGKEGQRGIVHSVWHCMSSVNS